MDQNQLAVLLRAIRPPREPRTKPAQRRVYRRTLNLGFDRLGHVPEVRKASKENAPVSTNSLLTLGL